MMEEIIIQQESPIIAVLRLNVDVIGYLVNSLSEDPSTKELIEKHSAFILELSDKITKSQRLDMKLVK
tara:strand:- start:257 stop:460 length:204 start_codon:yes stop_codon:yes gene_type:complete